jgi:hypothetical protein
MHTLNDGVSDKLLIPEVCIMKYPNPYRRSADSPLYALIGGELSCGALVGARFHTCVHRGGALQARQRLGNLGRAHAPEGVHEPRTPGGMQVRWCAHAAMRPRPGSPAPARFDGWCARGPRGAPVCLPLQGGVVCLLSVVVHESAPEGPSYGR